VESFLQLSANRIIGEDHSWLQPENGLMRIRDQEKRRIVLLKITLSFLLPRFSVYAPREQNRLNIKEGIRKLFSYPTT
jgi:hypothetical protein